MNIFYLNILFAFSSFFSILLFSPIAKKFNLLDIPNQRKKHLGKIPLIGGIIIFLNLFIYILFNNNDYHLIIIFSSSFIVLIIGILDDAIDISISIRLIFLFIATLVVIGSGLSIIDIGNYYYFYPIKLGIFGVLLTVLAVIGLTNSINFIDGIDGLCTLISIVCLLSIVLYGNILGNYSSFDFIYILISILFIFLIFNFGIIKNFKIFLGDSGSILLGFLISWLLIYYSHPSVAAIHPVLTIWCVSIPIFDFICVVIKRILNKKNPFYSDRTHIHHILIHRGFSHHLCLFIILLLSVLFSFIGGIVFYFNGPLFSLILFILCIILYTFINYRYSIKQNTI